MIDLKNVLINQVCMNWGGGTGKIYDSIDLEMFAYDEENNYVYSIVKTVDSSYYGEKNESLKISRCKQESKKMLNELIKILKKSKEYIHLKECIVETQFADTITCKDCLIKKDIKIYIDFKSTFNKKSIAISSAKDHLRFIYLIPPEKLKNFNPENIDFTKDLIEYLSYCNTTGNKTEIFDFIKEHDLEDLLLERLLIYEVSE